MSNDAVSARILAIDTTSEHGSLALLEGERVLEEVRLDSPDGFAHILFGEVEALLTRHGWKLADIDCFASASGPGAFTGVRVGLTAIKGLAEAFGKKAIAVSNLQALAAFGKRSLRATVIDARRGEVFGAVYDSSLRLHCVEAVTKFPAWLAGLPSGDLEIISGGFAVPGDCGFPVMNAPLAMAGVIGKIAAHRLARGETSDPAEIDANYVRRSDAELFWKDSV